MGKYWKQESLCSYVNNQPQIIIKTRNQKFEGKVTGQKSFLQYIYQKSTTE